MESAYLECKRLEGKIKAKNAELKELRNKYKDQKLALCNAMKAKNKKEYKGYTIEALTPKTNSEIKEARAAKEASMRNVLAINGIRDPEEVLSKIKACQRPKKKP